MTVVAALCIALILAQVSPAPAADAVTDDNVAERVASAQTAADHEALAAYFRGEAAKAGEKAKVHEDMLNSLRKVGGRTWPSWKTHCENLIKRFKEAQKDAQELAAEHERMAKEAK